MFNEKKGGRMPNNIQNRLRVEGNSEKVNALIERAKPRDFFDLHFIHVSEKLRKELHISVEQRNKIIEKVRKQDKKRLERELKMFLPKSCWRMIDDLPSVLIKDIS